MKCKEPRTEKHIFEEEISVWRIYSNWISKLITKLQYLRQVWYCASTEKQTIEHNSPEINICIWTINL